jgi:phosphate transport system permease protein
VEVEQRAPAPRREISSPRTRGDRIFRALAKASGFGTFVLLVLIGLFLAIKAWPALKYAGVHFFTTTEWTFNPVTGGGHFGIAAILYWTVVIGLVALVIAVPISLAAALFITEYAPRRLKGPLTSMIDLLAAVPSLIYGMWGFFFLQPRLQGLSAFLATHFGFIPIFASKDELFGSSAFVAGIVVSLMVIPITTAIAREVFSQAPPAEKEAALALGGTRWGMIRAVTIPFGKGGVIGGSMLGLGRALGETIAVAIIISPSFSITASILDRGANSVAARIALEFGDAANSPLHLSALMAAGLVLFLLTLVVNTIAAFVVARSRSGSGVDI